MSERVLSGIGAFKQRMPREQDALPGRSTPTPLHNAHFVHGRQLRGDFGELAHVQFGMGCFWNAERLFWPVRGVFTTAAGFAGGMTPNPSYREVCSGMTGHAETVLVVFDPQVCPLETLLEIFWENHDPTQGMAQGNDKGTQYRSAIYCSTPAHRAMAEFSRSVFQSRLRSQGFGIITTEVGFPEPGFYYADDEHQQYLAKNPANFCGVQGTGVAYLSHSGKMVA